MALNPRTWYPIAVVASLVNVAAAGYAATTAEPWHTIIHATLAVAAGAWAQHLRTRSRAGSMERGAETEIATLRDEVGEVRRELNELHERMDFAERLLSRAREMERGPSP